MKEKMKSRSKYGEVASEYYRQRRAKCGPYEYTGERFLRENPKRAAKAIEMIALGYPDIQIARKLGASHETIKVLRFRCVEDIARRKQELLQIVLPGSALAAEKAISLLKNEKQARNAAVVHGIFVDSIGKLTGGVTQKIEISGSVDIHARYDELARKITEKAAQGITIDAEAPTVEEQAPIVEQQLPIVEKQLTNGTDPDGT
jgi:hypothetical protein